MFSALIKSFKNKPSFPAIQADILAGLTVGVIALPLSMALAIASGVAPQHGLYTAIAAGIVIGLTGGSKVNISGPTAAFVVILLPIVQEFGLGGLLVSGFMAGIILILMGASGLGRLIEIVPYPVTVGFTAGIGVVIGTLQLKDFFGLDIAAFNGHYLEKLVLLAKAVPGLDWRETLIGLVTLAILLFWTRLKNKIPAHLVALSVGSLLVFGLEQLMPDFSVATIGSRFHYHSGSISGAGIPPFLPSFQLPWQQAGADGAPIGLSFTLVHKLVGSAVTIAILGALESLLCAVVADGMSGKKHNPNDELIGQGIGNMVVPFFGGIPATAAIARTAASIRAGATTPLASVIHGVFMLLAILFFAPILSYIPMASMAALLLMVAWNMSEAKHFIRTIRVAPHEDVMTLLSCFLLTIIFDMTIAVAIGMGLAATLFIRRSISLTDAIPLDKEDIDPLLPLPKEVAIYAINGPLFFGSAQKALKNLLNITPEIQIIILDMSKVTLLDMSAIVIMESIVKDLQQREMSLIINNLQPRMLLKLRRVGVHTMHGIHFSRTLNEALEKSCRV